ncbi:AAA-like domain-containing protein [Nostoc sp. CHAB 5844]|nr:AAA-like domain-containing protein [Nostoc sp. CHAB 5844]
MAEPTIYTVGGTVQANAQGLYIPRQADQELLELCRNAEFAYILTPRQLGKSSLMIRTAEQLIAEGVQCVIIDISGNLGVNLTAEEWYKGLLTIIADQLLLTTNLEQWWQTHNHLGVTQRLTKFFTEVLLTEINDCVVIFIDEIDTTLSLDFTDDFYATIRYFHVARATNPEFRRLSFVLIGVATPSDLIQDPKRTPFNIGQRVDLTDFTFEEAQPLATGLGLPIKTGQQVLQWVLKWTGGHPYLSQRLCRILADRNQENWSEVEVDRIVSSTFFGTASEQDNNLQFVRDMLTIRAPDINSVLTVYQQIWRSRHLVVDEEQSLVKSHLKLSGVVKREGKILKIRNDIYREVFNNAWINSHLPVNWAKRLQRAAVILIGLILFSSVPLALIGWNLALERDKLKKMADKKALEADQQRQIAEQLRVIAENNATTANEQRQIAEQLRVIAENNATTANEQRQIADKQRAIAQQQKIKAQLAQQQEAKQRRIAENLRSQAETARRLAESGQQDAIAAQEKEARQRQLAVIAQKEEARQRQVAVIAQKAEAEQRQIAVIAQKEEARQRQVAVIAQKAEAEQRKIAEKAKLIQTLAAQALAFRDVFPQRSLLFAVESVNRGKNIVRRTEAGGLLRRLLGEIGGSPLIGHEKPVVAVAFSPKGNWLATGSKDGTVRLWDKLNPDKPAIILQENIGEVKAVAISPDGKWLGAIANDTRILLWDISKPKFNTAPQILQGHTKPINDLSFSPNGKWLATAGQDTTIRLWELANNIPGSQQIVLRGHSSPVQQVIFSSSGRWLATHEQESINPRLWKMQTISQYRKPIILKAQKNGEEVMLGLAFSPDEKRLAGAISYSIQTWDLTAQNLAATKAVILGLHDQWIYSIAFSPDSRKLATGSKDAKVKLWDMQSLKRSQTKSSTCQTDEKDTFCRVVLSGHTATVDAVQFSPDGKWLGSGSRDSTTKLWNIADLSVPPVVLQGHEGSVNTITFDADGQWLATGGEDTQARLWKVPNVLNDPIVFSGIKNRVRANAISPDGNWIASAGGDNIIRLWNTNDLVRPPILLAGHKLTIDNLAFSPNGQWLASASLDGTVRLWNMTNPATQPHILKGPAFWSMAFSSSGRWLAAGSYDGTVQLWDINKGSLPTKPSFVLNQNLGVRSLAFSPDERRLVTGGDALSSQQSCGNRLALVWDLTNPNANANPISLPGHCYAVLEVAFSPNNRWVATASWDSTVRLWDLTSSNPSASAKIIKFDPIERVFHVAFSPDGRWLAAGSWNHQVKLQDMNNLDKEPDLLIGHQERVFGVEFSPDSQWLATSSEDHTIRLWNPKDITAAPIVLRGHDAGIEALAFSSDSHWLLSGSSDVRLWRVSFSNDELIKIACRTAGRNLTLQEWQQFFDKEPYRQTCPELPSHSSRAATNNFRAMIWQKFREAIAQTIIRHN